jgi:hypothetical protein
MNEQPPTSIVDDKIQLEVTVGSANGYPSEQEQVNPLLGNSDPPMLDPDERRPTAVSDDEAHNVNNMAAPSVSDTDSDTEETDDEVEEKKLCQECKHEPGEWYCGSCTQRYCERCWRKKSSHKKKSPEYTKHMKVPFANQ